MRKPRLAACGFALILALSICLTTALASDSAAATDDSSYHYDDEYDDEYDDTYDDGDGGTADQQQQQQHHSDSDKSIAPPVSSSSTRSPAGGSFVDSSTTAAPPPPPLWSDEDDVREEYPCPRECTCEDGTKFLNCSHRGLVRIPSDLPRNVLRLDLSENNLKTVPVEAFQNCTDVREILLDGNVIEQLDKEVFMGLVRLDVLGLARNQLNHLEVDTFGEAHSLRRLVLNENPLVVPDEGPFLEQDELEELEMARCNLTELTKDTFGGLVGLKWVNLAGNEFDEDFSTDVFEPLENLQRLHLPPLSEDAVRELCDVVKSIDVVDITTHNISCFYLASETSYEESIITQRPITPEPKKDPTEDSDDDDDDAESKSPSKPTKPTKKVIPKENEIDSDQQDQSSNSTPAPSPAKSALPARRSSSTTSTTSTTAAPPTVSGPSSASITHAADDPSDDVRKETTPEQSDQSLLASISSDTMKQLLMGIIGLALLVLMIGIICRQTGLKNKLCGSKRRPAPTDQVRPAEEVPLNKV